MHDNKELSKAEKFQYLRLLLTGTAMTAVRGLQATEACYEDAVEILQRRFGDKEKIEQEHLAKLRSLPSVTLSEDVCWLRRLYDHVQAHIRGLKGLGMSTSSYLAMLSGVILSELSKEMVVDFPRELSRANRAETPTSQSPHESAASPALGTDSRLSDILDFLLVEMVSRERCIEGARAPKPPKVPHGGAKSKQQRAPSAAILNTQTERAGEEVFPVRLDETRDEVLPARRKDEEIGQSRALLSLYIVGAPVEKV